MTLTDVIKWKNGSLEEYQELLDLKEKLEKKIRANADRLDDENVALECFDESEHNTSAYQKHLNKQAFYATKALKLNNEYDRICKKIITYQS